MRKIFCLLMLFVLLNGCAESMALIGGSANGKVVQSSFNTAVSYGIKQRTGKTPFQHALKYAEEKKVLKASSENKIQPCVEFLEPVSGDICTIIRNKIAELSKVKNLN